jgi:hypothetical protein
VGEDGRESAGAARSQHVVLQGSPDARTMATAMRAGIERSRGEHEPGAPTCLVITPTVEQALTAADQARALLCDPAIRVVPVTAPARARRVLAAAPVGVVTGTAADLLALRRASALRLDRLATMVLVGLDELLDVTGGVERGGAATLDALLADVPDDASRVATVARERDDVEAFLEAHLRRARRIAATPTPVLAAASDDGAAVTPQYVACTVAGRGDALRALLDAIDPPSLVVVAESARGEQEAREALERLGVPIDGLAVTVTREAPATHVALLVLWGLPSGHDALSAAFASRPVDAVALLAPDDVPGFMQATGGTAAPWVPPARRDAAEQRAGRLRAALRAALEVGSSASEMALLAPLLDRHDALEIAAATLRLYEAARRDADGLRAQAAAVVTRPRATATGGAPVLTLVPSSGAGGGGRQRVFFAVGKRDNIRVGDLVGAIANEAGIPGERIGAVELYESHATVEMSGEDAQRAVEALAQVSLRGRRLHARIDERSGGPPSRDRGARGDRPARAGFGRDRGSEGRGSGGRGPRRTDSERRAFGDRPMRERTESRGEWAERGERMARSKRPERPTRPRTDRPDEG